MAELRFKQLSFEEHKGHIRAYFLKLFYFDIVKEELNKISDFTIEKDAIAFKGISEKTARNKFNFLLEKGLNNLKNSLNGNRTIYIHKNSGIPLIGTLSFGIVDRGSDMIELKPVTSCNINCIFCSVDEGISSKKTADYVVEKDYLVEELKKLAEFKNCKVDVYINPHGEPLLYAEIVDLVRDISKIKNTRVLSIITNGTLLDKKLADELIKAGLNRINLSINAINPEIARKLAGTSNYDISKVLDIAKYISKKIELVIAPVLVPAINEHETEKLIEFAKGINARILIQNFLYNKRGRNPLKPLPLDEFYSKLKLLEEKYGARLIINCPVSKTKELAKPFNTGDIVKARIALPGRYEGEKIAVAGNRSILIRNCYKTGSVKIRIVKSRHNVIESRPLSAF